MALKKIDIGIPWWQTSELNDFSSSSSKSREEKPNVGEKTVLANEKEKGVGILDHLEIWNL